MATLKRLTADNAEIKIMLRTKVINAETYDNLPVASKTTQGVVKIDDTTIKKNAQGELYCTIEELELPVNEVKEHLNDSDKHFDSKEQKEDIIKYSNDVKDHMEDPYRHLSQEQIDALFEAQLHLEDEDSHFLNGEKEQMKQDVKDSVDKVNDHSKDDNKHFTPGEKAKMKDDVKKVANDLVSHASDDSLHPTPEQLDKLNGFTTHTTNRDIHFIGTEKADMKDDISSLKNDLKKFEDDLQELDEDFQLHAGNDRIHLTLCEKDKIFEAIENLKDLIGNGNDCDEMLRELQSHINNSYVHLTQSEKQEIIDNMGRLVEHINNNDIHLTQAMKNTIDSISDHINDSDIHMTNDFKNAVIEHMYNKEIHSFEGNGSGGNGGCCCCCNGGGSGGGGTGGGGNGDGNGEDGQDCCLVKGLEGQVVYYSEDNSNKHEGRLIVQEGVFCETQQELDDAKGRTADFSEIFNSWKRFSHDGVLDPNDAQPANETDMNAWIYESSTNSVKCTANTNSYIGFVSSDKFENYVHEATFKSADADDDMIGMVIAFVVDSNGREHTLTAVRVRNMDQAHVNAGGAGMHWSVTYNYRRSDSKVIATKIVPGDTNGGWSDIPNGIRVKVERSGDSIKAYTSQMNSPGSYDASATLDIDLNSDPVLAKFKGAQSYGYSALSQTQATFVDINLSGAENVIWDLRDASGWVKQSNGSYAIDPSLNFYKDVGVGRICYDKYTKKIYFVKNGSFVYAIHRPSHTYSLENRIAGGISDNRPVLSESDRVNYFDDTLNKPIWWNGYNWVDVNGVTV